MNSSVWIREVGQENFQKEMVFIERRVVPTHPFVSLMTWSMFHPERIPSADIEGDPDFLYSSIIRTVNTFNLLEVGVAFFNEAGDLPRCPETGHPCLWQFNLKYPQDNDSLQLWFVLQRVFHASSDIRCVVFKGGLDFGYLVNLEPHRNHLPADREEFLTCVRRSYPLFYDVMHLAAILGVGADGTLAGVAAAAGGVAREIPPGYKTASNSLLVLRVFMKMKQERFGGALLLSHANNLFGLMSYWFQRTPRKEIIARL